MESKEVTELKPAHKIPESAKFSFRALPSYGIDRMTENGEQDEHMNTKIASEDANLII